MFFSVFTQATIRAIVEFVFSLSFWWYIDRLFAVITSNIGGALFFVAITAKTFGKYLFHLVTRLTFHIDIIPGNVKQSNSGTVPAVCKQLNRQYLAFEIDPVTADLARQRVANTQPPLPIIYPEQMEIAL
jgi:hypothetical protein